MIERHNILSLVRDRLSQPSFHIAAEKHVRIEYRNLTGGQMIARFAYGGDLVVTCYRGAFAIKFGAGETVLREFDQAVVPAGTAVTFVCEASGTMQLIWSPPQSPTKQTAELEQVFLRQTEASDFAKAINDPTERVLTEVALARAISFLLTDGEYQAKCFSAPFDLLNFARAAHAFFEMRTVVRDILSGTIASIDDLSPFP
jgi:hypothetical protein